MSEKVKIDISESTLKRIMEFFLNTSVPIIIEEDRKQVVKDAS